VPVPPLGDPCCLQELRGASGTLDRRTRTVICSVRPVRRFDALRVGHPPNLHPARKPGFGPPCTFVLLRRRVPAAPQRGVVHRFRRTDGDDGPAVQPLLGFGALRHSPGPADPHEGDESLRRRVPRAGFGYPLRDVHHRSSRRAKRRSVHGLDPSRYSPRARAVLLSESLPS
jgi:hypothetical protein